MPVRTPNTSAMDKGQDLDFTLVKSAGLPLNRFPETEDEVGVAEQVLEQAFEKLTLEDYV
jgi:hypothetical protein